MAGNTERAGRSGLLSIGQYQEEHMDLKEYEERYAMIENGLASKRITGNAALAAVAMLTLDYANSSDRRMLDDGTKLGQELAALPARQGDDADRAKVRAAYLDHTRGVIERSEARREQAAREKIERDPLG
jgi:hypothetical protein